eukprot:SM000253S09054  [mRNA]  locus=s253:17168:19059:- [translate_table: standard]
MQCRHWGVVPVMKQGMSAKDWRTDSRSRHNQVEQEKGPQVLEGPVKETSRQSGEQSPENAPLNEQELQSFGWRPDAPTTSWYSRSLELIEQSQIRIGEQELAVQSFHVIAGRAVQRTQTLLMRSRRQDEQDDVDYFQDPTSSEGRDRCHPDHESGSSCCHSNALAIARNRLKRGERATAETRELIEVSTGTETKAPSSVLLGTAQQLAVRLKLGENDVTQINVGIRTATGASDGVVGVTKRPL